MNKKNNKGLTVVELIVSIILISIVMLFMYRMLSAITFEKDNDFIATQNQEQRIEMIETIEKAYQDAYKNSAISNLCLSIENDGSKGYITLKEGKAPRNKWEIKGGKVYATDNVDCKPLPSSEYICVYKIMINTLHDKNSSSNNNLLDDIVFTYYTNDANYKPRCES